MKMVFLVKDGGSVRHFYSEAAMVAAGFKKAHKTVTEEAFNSNGCYARIVDGDIVIGRTEAEITAENALAESERIKAEIASRDYRALKAQKLGKTIDELYPGETDWYKTQLARLSELEAVIAENKTAA